MGGKLVIINLQKTPLDHEAAMCIYGKCDDIVKKLMAKLNLDIPEWRLNRRCEISYNEAINKISVRGLDEHGNHYSLFKSVTLSSGKVKVCA